MGTRHVLRRDLGLVRRKNESNPCGLCGRSTQLTRTHVPPQCAGNRGIVGRRRFVLQGQQADLTKRSPGGLYVFGLCESCNNLQSRFDDSYRELVGAVRHLWIRDWRIRTAGRLALPDDLIRPGGVARSVLIGFFGLSPHLRVNFPAVADQLLSGATSIHLPAKLRLRLALARGNMARVSGATAGFLSVPHPPGEDAVGIVSLGQVYFPPLAWQLAPPGSSALLATPSNSLLDRQGWADVTSWLQRPPEERERLAGLCPTLPAVVHPRHHPGQSEWWVEMFSDQITEFLECDNLPPVALDDVRQGP